MIRAQEIKIKDVLGSKSITVKVGKVLQKTAVAATMKGAIPYIFPSEEVTYTITVYNPYTDTLTGIAVTDTLPGNPDPFIYVRMADTNAPPTILEEGRKLAWTLESIPVGGFTTRSFVVRIPRNTIIPDNKTSYDYKNILDAFHPKVKFFTEKGLATVRVRAALVITKAVSIARPQPGQTIIYTVTLNNQGVYPLYGLRITDTIAIDPDRRSYFLRMLNGPDPLLDYNKNPMVWDGIDLNSRQAAQLIFEVYPDGHWLDKYCNRVDASERGDGTTTPTDIPSITNKACIVIDSPVKLIKTVEPDEIFPGDTVEYTISIYNDTLQDTWTIDRIVDSLPPGFNQVNVGNPAVIELSPPEDILPGSQIDLPFSVVVSPEELNCADLPKTYWNPAKAIAVHFTAPMTITGYNPSALAPLKINPHVVSDLIPQRQAVLPGSYVTYTLSLFNGSSVAAQNATVSVNLPADVIFVKMIGDNDPNVDYVATVEGTLVTWDGVNIAPVSELQIYFQVQIAENASYGVKTPTLQASATGVCFGKLATGDDPLGTGKINVVEEVVILSKKHLMKTVPVDSLVDYTLSIRNIDAYSYRVQLVTDTLPTGFTFVDMLVGPQPVQQIGNQLVWQNVDVGGKATVTWKIRLKSATLFNYYLNYLSAYSRETPIKTTSDSDLKEALDDLRGGVLVYPVLAVIKESGVTETVAGTVVPYTITLINQSDVSYNQVMVTDTLPTGFTFVKVHPGTSAPSFVSSDKAIVSWKGLTLPKSTGKIVLIIDAKIDRSTPPGAYFNNVEASSPTGSIPNIGPTALVSVTPAPLPKASVSMEVRPTVVDQGGVVTYTITLAHSYDAAIGQITITDTLPAGFSYLKTLTGPAPAAEGRQPVWRNLSAGTSCKAGCAILVFEAQVDPNTATGVRYNEVAGQSPQAVFENPDPGAPVTVNPYSPVLPTISIAKQAGITEVVAGGIVPYIIRITNDTGQGVNQISITDTLPAGFTYLQMSNGPEPTVRGGQIVWDDLSLGDSCNGGPCILELAFSTQVLSDTIGDTYYNSITGGSPNANINGEGPTAPVSVQDYDPELPTVKLTKKANIAKVKNGGVVAYTITIAYKDGVDIGSLLVVDTLPTGFEFIEMTNGPAPIVGGVQPVWGNIPAGECDGTTCTATLSFTAQVSPNTPKASYYNSVSGSSSLVNVIGSGPTAKVDVTYQGRLYLPYILR